MQKNKNEDEEDAPGEPNAQILGYGVLNVGVIAVAASSCFSPAYQTTFLTIIIQFFLFYLFTFFLELLKVRFWCRGSVFRTQDIRKNF